MLRQVLLLLCALRASYAGPEEDEGVRFANRCEACKILATELQQRLQETGKTHDVIEIGYSLDDVKPKKRTEYRRSELRLLESMEDVCERVLAYNLHKEREDSTRFAKGMSQTFKTLHNLVDKGVKVDLGIPYELWDSPPIEVTRMKAQCENMLEEYEDVISDWYFRMQNEKTLIKHLCEDEVLQADERKCLSEVFVPKDDDDDDNGKSDEQSRNKVQKGKVKINERNTKNDKEEL